ncbi:MAG TPA: hypothetical protein VHP11_09740, partial [Tepidisphaeraceae bacterium]|nr:hypothetical protein [Tepidisphaeraceae bacterium]
MHLTKLSRPLKEVMNRLFHPRTKLVLTLLLGLQTQSILQGAEAFDAAPFGLPLPEGNGLMWEDPREIHQVIVRFKEPVSSPEQVKLEYWGSWWPERHLPKDKEPGGGDVGWMELGNWYKYGWRKADTEVKAEGATLSFSFRPVNAKEFPKVEGYPAKFRYTLKLRVTAPDTLPKIENIQVLTDSSLAPQTARLVFQSAPSESPICEAFNGKVKNLEKLSPTAFTVHSLACTNSDPNTFDRTLITVRLGKEVFTFKVDDLTSGPLYLPHLGVAVLSGNDQRDYAAIGKAQEALAGQSLYDRITRLPEQTWGAAWESIPRKKSHIYFPLGLDGGRQRFRLNGDGSINFRHNDHYLKGRPGKDTPRLDLEKPSLSVRFGFSDKPAHRTLEEESLPICRTTWEQDGLRVEQTAFVTQLEGTSANAPTPPADALTVFLARFEFKNTTKAEKPVVLPLAFGGDESFNKLRVDADGLIWSGERLRGQVLAGITPEVNKGKLNVHFTLAPGKSRAVAVKIPYLALTEASEHKALQRLDFNREHKAVAKYWRQRLDQSARLITPEPMLNEFYRSHAMHLLVNCEREPNSDRRFARVGSFSYGAYGNESCMMVVDLDRRGYHKEAQDCLDAWLHYQGTVKLPGDFASQEGILYGAGGYEAGGYNQHHGWILWMLAEHFRFTRDQDWLRRSAPGLVKASDWIINETARTAHRHELERGLLPAGSLEDIGDWWTWLSTSC